MHIMHVLDYSFKISLLFDHFLTFYICIFRNVRQMPDYGKHVRWPQPPRMLGDKVRDFQSIHSRWRAHMILSSVPSNEWPQLRLKVLRLKSSLVWFCYFMSELLFLNTLTVETMKRIGKNLK